LILEYTHRSPKKYPKKTKELARFRVKGILEV
jgi:hypothetical protein